MLAQDPVEHATRLFVVVFDYLGPNLQPAGHLIDHLAVEVLELVALGDQPSDGLAPHSELVQS